MRNDQGEGAELYNDIVGVLEDWGNRHGIGMDDKDNLKNVAEILNLVIQDLPEMFEYVPEPPAPTDLN